MITPPPYHHHSTRITRLLLLLTEFKEIDKIWWAITTFIVEFDIYKRSASIWCLLMVLTRVLGQYWQFCTSMGCFSVNTPGIALHTNSLWPPYLPTVIGTVVAICFVWHIGTLKNKFKTNTLVRKSRDGDCIYYFVVFGRPDSFSVSLCSESTSDKHNIFPALLAIVSKEIQFINTFLRQHHNKTTSIELDVIFSYRWALVLQ